MADWSHDLVLKALQRLPDPVGSLVRAFPGRAQADSESEWLEDWFLDLTRTFAKGSGPDAKKIITSGAKPGELSLLAKAPVQASVRLVSIQPRYFRGFRVVPKPIPFDSDMVVIEGRNSSGKTSLSEAIEWVLTGQLSRRTSGQYGHASELAECIGNEFCPEGEETSVTLVLSVNGKGLELRRVLKRDYSTTASEEPQSELFMNGTAASNVQENDLRMDLFAGVHPILMQHNLRKFVHDDPTSRRQYFERLLQVDELTALIERAVIGPTKLSQLPNPEGGAGLAALKALVAELDKDPNWKPQVQGLKKIEKMEASAAPLALEPALVIVAKGALPTELEGPQSITQCRDAMTRAQKTQRETRLPLLGVLEKARSQALPEAGSIQDDLPAFIEASEELRRISEEANALSEAQRELARAMERLVSVSLVDERASGSQVCPVCEDTTATLTAARVKQLLSWSPVSSALDRSVLHVRQCRDRLEVGISRLRAGAQGLAPMLPSAQEIGQQLQGASERVATLAKASLDAASVVETLVAAVTDGLDKLAEEVRAPIPVLNEVEGAFRIVVGSLDRLGQSSVAFRAAIAHLEEAVGAASFDDTGYRLRERWLDVAGLTTSVAEDVAWERAKGKGKEALDGLRDALITLRGEIIEDARRTFSDAMTGVWQLLRSDSGAKFSRILVPPARGRGYKLEFELKATISDGQSNPEVDALRVFSESQINVIGIAAYVTRARLLGHRVLIFDDPVQSMDEEYFRSFSANLLPKLLDQGFQILILTHSDTFARRLNDQHYPRESYMTLETRTDPKHGCQVVEGNRRVSERLANARRSAKEGDLANAWRFVRLAVERIYTLAYASQNAKFDPDTWKDLAAESMWNQGVDDIVEKAVPGSTRRLKEILTATVPGAHDKAANSETDVIEAAKFLAGLLAPLHLGGG